ncbi:hypothetical protein [Streptomyces sp. NPDC091209]|uniref:hypothetical protein n=1 Tax=Streptomyces sp. NPDC091209 TaxID=3365974 RepID=UPI0037FF3AA0
MGIRDGYKRELSPHWKDDDKNGCTARNDVPTAEAIEAPTVAGVRGADGAGTGGAGSARELGPCDTEGRRLFTAETIELPR